MADSANLALPFLEAAQAQKHVTHNEALSVLDAVVQLSVLDRDLAAPPGGPAEGSRYLVAGSATGAWAGQSGTLAAFQDGGWMFFQPREGWLAWIADEDIAVIYDGTSWVSVVSLQNLASVGINATADTTNRLTVASTASLFSHAGSGHQLKINKAAAVATASVLFQDAYSGRAEMGLMGDDDFRFKVSADGSAWRDALRIDRANGAVSFPNSPGIGTASQIEIDFGTGAVREKRFTVALAGITAANRIVAFQSGRAATGRAADENEMDALSIRANANSGSVTLFATALTGRVSGRFAVTVLAF